MCQNMLTSSIHTTAKQVISRRRKNENVFKMSRDDKCTCKACKNTVFHCQICKFVVFLLPSSSWLLKLPNERRECSTSTNLREKNRCWSNSGRKIYYFAQYLEKHCTYLNFINQTNKKLMNTNELKIKLCVETTSCIHTFTFIHSCMHMYMYVHSLTFKTVMKTKIFKPSDTVPRACLVFSSFVFSAPQTFLPNALIFERTVTWMHL